MNIWLSPRLSGPVAALLALALAVPVGCRKQISKEEHLKNLTPEQRAAFEPMHNTPNLVAGIESPRFLAADEVDLWPKALVIGVVVDDQPRAYPLSKMSAMNSHVINDVVTTTTGVQRPITVTYCDKSDCIRVLTHAEAEGSLGIGILGLLNGGLALRWEDQQFEQMAEVEGLEDVPFEQVSWDEWRKRYPETLVYQGRGS